MYIYIYDTYIYRYQEQERPLIGVRGQRKDLGRVAKLIRDKVTPLPCAKAAEGRALSEAS